MDLWLIAALVGPAGVALGLGLGRLAWGRSRNHRAGGPAEATSRAYRRSLDALLAGEHDRAIEELTRLLEAEPDTVETYLALGTLFRVAGDAHRAARIHKTVTVREALDEPTRRQARLAVGLDFQAAGHVDEAVAALEALVRDASDLAPAWRALAELHEAAGRYGKAYEALGRHGKLTGATDARALARLKVAEGRALATQGERGAARKTFQKAVAIAPSDAVAHAALAAFHRDDRSAGKAAAAAAAAIEAEPRGAWIVWRALGDDLFEILGAERAAAVLDKAAERFGRPAEILAVLARLRARGGQVQDALGLLDEAAERAAPAFAPALRLARADALARAGRTDEALAAIAEAASSLD